MKNLVLLFAMAGLLCAGMAVLCTACVGESDLPVGAALSGMKAPSSARWIVMVAEKTPARDTQNIMSEKMIIESVFQAYPYGQATVPGFDRNGIFMLHTEANVS